MSQNIINTELGYFEQDVKYDKKFYTNNCFSILKMLGALAIMYIIHFFIFWGHLALGTTNTEAYLGVEYSIFRLYRNMDRHYGHVRKKEQRQIC